MGFLRKIMTACALYINYTNISLFLSQLVVIPLDKLQLLGITSLFVAAKYEEIYPPYIREMAYITADAYTCKQIREMEGKILRKLQYMFNKPHMLNFLRRYSKVAGVTPLEHSLAKYILELSLMQSELSAVSPSLKAASALQLALQLSPTKRKTTPTWPAVLVKHSTYKAHHLAATRKELKGALCYGHNHPELTTTKLKFKRSRFGCVSELAVLKGLSH